MPETAEPQTQSLSSKPKATLIIPLALVIALLVLLAVALRSGDSTQLPSALIGKPVPQFSLPPVPQLMSERGPLQGISSATFKRGEPSILNVWASWCAPCQVEHPLLVQLSRSVPVYGINYKDKPESARRFLAKLGNPYLAVGADESGLASIDFGVYGVPETFVIDGAGRIIYRYPGPLTSEIVSKKIMPALAQAKRDQPRS